MTYAIQLLTEDMTGAQLATLALAAPFLALCITFGLGSILWGRG